MMDLQRISGDEGFGEHTLSKPELMSLEDRLRDLIDLMDCHVTYVEKSKKIHRRKSRQRKFEMKKAMVRQVTVDPITVYLEPSLVEKYEEICKTYNENRLQCLCDDLAPAKHINGFNLFSDTNFDHWIKAWIGFLKDLGGFRDFDESDRWNLCSESLLEFDMIDGIMHTSVNGESILMEDKKNLEVYLPWKLYLGLHGCHTQKLFSQIMSSFLPKWRCDEKLMCLLFLIAFFNPDRRVELKNRQQIWKIQDMFYTLLRKYLRAKYPEEHGCVFVGLIGILDAIRRLAKMLYDAQTDGGFLTNYILYCGISEMHAEFIRYVMKNRYLKLH